MPTSFTIVQENKTTNVNNNSLTSSVIAGNKLIVVWQSGTSTGGNPTLPTSVTDNNSNVYDLISFTYPGQPSQATSGIYICHNPVLTPNNPPILMTSGATSVPSGGPSIFFLEMNFSTNYTVSGALCNRNSVPGSPIVLSTGQMNGVGTSANLTLTSNTSNEEYANAIAIFQNPYSDAFVLFCDYDCTTSSVTWSTSGVLIDQTAEAQSGTSGRSAAIAYQLLTYSSSVCGYSGISANCNNLPNGILGHAYSWPLGLSGGTYPYTWAITAGGLPTGLSLNTSTGVISGTPSSTGSWWFTFTVTDATMTTSTPVTCSIGICGNTGANLVYYSRH